MYFGLPNPVISFKLKKTIHVHVYESLTHVLKYIYMYKVS